MEITFRLTREKNPSEKRSPPIPGFDPYRGHTVVDGPEIFIATDSESLRVTARRPLGAGARPSPSHGDSVSEPELQAPQRYGTV
jgi:hypothetical protein